MNYSVRLIINGGIINGGEMLESAGDFIDSLMFSSIAGAIEIPMGSTEGNWNIRIILRNHLGIVTNIGPNQLENQNYQNYIHIDNVELGHSTFHSIPKEFSLNQNYPNPFNPLTKIDFSVATKSKVKLTIYNIMGIEVAVILNNVVPIGTQSATWDAKDQSSGIYFIHMQTDGYSSYKKIMLIK